MTVIVRQTNLHRVPTLPTLHRVSKSGKTHYEEWLWYTEERYFWAWDMFCIITSLPNSPRSTTSNKRPVWKASTEKIIFYISAAQRAWGKSEAGPKQIRVFNHQPHTKASGLITEQWNVTSRPFGIVRLPSPLGDDFHYISISASIPGTYRGLPAEVSLSLCAVSQPSDTSTVWKLYEVQKWKGSWEVIIIRLATAHLFYLP